ncbi:MAG: tyrosine-type recombinase/integrase [Pirellulaceae bacterium]|nr:tyrosine-type recombinase/integrase [Pirellulaceae bacterium]
MAVEAAYSKRRRRDVQPIRQDLAGVLRIWLADRADSERVFGSLPRVLARTLRKDLDAARAAWIAAASTKDEREAREKSQFLCYVDDDGRIADFHSLRHTYISRIVAGGASVRTAQELARHSDPRLTIGRYAHAQLHSLTSALDALPNCHPLAAEPAQVGATGTDDSHPRSAWRSAQEAKRRQALRMGATKKRSGRAAPTRSTLALTCCPLRT